jgi:hypothetical protein
MVIKSGRFWNQRDETKFVNLIAKIGSLCILFCQARVELKSQSLEGQLKKV